MMAGAFLVEDLMDKQVSVCSFMQIDSDLKKLCESMVTIFDSSFLELKRKSWKEEHTKM